MIQPVFPTEAHARVAEAIKRTFAADAAVDTILITNSCARGRATPESDLDLVLLVKAGLPSEGVRALESRWAGFMAQDAAVLAYLHTGQYAHIHADVITGVYTPTIWDDGGGPDAFELEIGNHVAYSAPLTSPGPTFQSLRARWLPYYEDRLQAARLTMVRTACLFDLDRVAFYVRRDLPFQAFDRLYKAHQEFLQGLFIAWRRYPLAYNKWIHEQVVEWLGLPDVYAQLLWTLAVPELTNPHLDDRAARLHGLVTQWLNV
ncbi:MAG: nucleotidyltransferase domain-containing protein [Anaerolineales bacterium]|nr:nucleotidyltransferase domain-containing protein [Anaerolineales bacterium]